MQLWTVARHFLHLLSHLIQLRLWVRHFWELKLGKRASCNWWLTHNSGLLKNRSSFARPSSGLKTPRSMRRPVSFRLWLSWNWSSWGWRNLKLFWTGDFPASLTLRTHWNLLSSLANLVYERHFDSSQASCYPRLELSTRSHLIESQQKLFDFQGLWIRIL